MKTASFVFEPAGTRRTAQYLIRRCYEEKDFMEIRVAVVGNVDAGKSTLLGVLTHGELDNGRGFARQALFRYYTQFRIYGPCLSRLKWSSL